MVRVPRATYRVQFNAGFTFRDARAIAPYLAELGISDIYASPILKARKGSTHGYDVVDASALNPELGTEDDFTALHEELRRLGMGLLLDIVPNHMAASAENAWWMSVLENGPQSRFRHYFFLPLKPDESPEKVLLPILGRPYGDTLASPEIRLGFDADGFFFTYYDRRLPLAPSSYRQVLQRCVESVPHEGVAIALRELVEGGAASARRAPAPWRRPTRTSTRSTRCSTRSGIASRTGASPARRSTTGASSTSPISSACASRIRRFSRHATAARWSSSPRGK